MEMLFLEFFMGKKERNSMCFCKQLQQAWRSIQQSSSLLQNWFIPKAFKAFQKKSTMHVKLFLKHGGLGLHTWNFGFRSKTSCNKGGWTKLVHLHDTFYRLICQGFINSQILMFYYLEHKIHGLTCFSWNFNCNLEN